MLSLMKTIYTLSVCLRRNEVNKAQMFGLQSRCGYWPFSFQVQQTYRRLWRVKKKKPLSIISFFCEFHATLFSDKCAFLELLKLCLLCLLICTVLWTSSLSYLLCICFSDPIHLQGLSFIAVLSSVVSLRRKLASAGTPRQSCGVQGSDEINAL